MLVVPGWPGCSYSTRRVKLVEMVTEGLCCPAGVGCRRSSVLSLLRARWPSLTRLKPLVSRWHREICLLVHGVLWVVSWGAHPGASGCPRTLPAARAQAASKALHQWCPALF